MEAHDNLLLPTYLSMTMSHIVPVVLQSGPLKNIPQCWMSDWGLKLRIQSGCAFKEILVEVEVIVLKDVTGKLEEGILRIGGALGS